MDSLNINDLVITIDNATSIGLNELDEVKCSFDITSYYTTRTALIDNIVNNGEPFAITLSNSTGDSNYESLIKGINNFLKESNLKCSIITSSESNFKIKQSSISISVIGKQVKKDIKDIKQPKYILIGLPLVGEEVLNNKESIVKVQEILTLLKSNVEIIPVSSKGIKDTMNKFNIDNFSINIDINKSGGPSTAVVVKYNSIDENIFNDIKTKITKIKV